MNLLKKTFVSALLLTVASSVNATLIDFKADANATERGYSTLTYIDASGTLDITAFDGASNAYAYMDKGNAGLGACPKIDGGFQCDPSSEDNVRRGETVRMVWDTDILITGIWFNNNHDSDFRLDGDTISIGGDDYMFTAADFDASRSSGNGTLNDAVAKRNADFLYATDRLISASDAFDISWFNDQFYISAIQYEAVPEPGMLALLSIGLIGIGLARTRK